MRDKRYGWHAKKASVTFPSEEKPVLSERFPYIRMYLSLNPVRKSCFSCPYTQYDRQSDITLADFLSYIVTYDDLNKTVTDILNLNLKEEIDLNVINDYVNTIRENLVNTQVAKLNKRISEETDSKKQAELAEQICELRKQEINL